MRMKKKLTQRNKKIRIKATSKKTMLDKKPNLQIWSTTTKPVIVLSNAANLATTN